MSTVVALLVDALLAVTPPGVSSCLTPPVTTAIAARFVAPSCPYCSGHRTIDFSASIGAEVVAPIDGTVTFSGMVAGSPYITVSVSSRSRMGPLGFGVDSFASVDTEPTGTGPVESDSADLQGSTHLVTIGGVIADRGAVAGSFVLAGRRIGSASAAQVRLSVRRTVPGGEAVYLDPEDSLVRWRAPARLVPPPGTPAGRVVTRVWTCRRPL
ncbi:MAG: hypothetical protein RLZ37_734 [Actinomycetota bacterium]|jgi:hypothetical protein